MPSFEYEALDGGGRSRRGVVNADSARLARQELRRLQLTPVSITTPREKAGAEGARKTPKIGASELVNLTRQLAVLIGASTPLEEALNAVALQTEKPGSRKRLLAVRERVLEGWRFADALGEDRKSFSDLYRAVVAAGETSGDLSGVLDRLATMLEKNRTMLNKAIASLIYPAALAMVAGLVVTALMTQVVPKIVEQFQTFDAKLPFVTQFVIGISNFLGAYGLYLILGAVLGGVMFWRAMRTPIFKLAFDRWILTVPLLGKLLRGLDGARFARTLATLFAGGAPLLDSLKGAQRTIGNSYMRDRLDGAITQVREGASLAGALKRAAVLPPMMTHMIAAGERAGAVPLMLDKSATQLEEEFDTASTVALRLLEPAIIIAMGGTVMLIVVAILLPILRLNSLASG
ncbi:MAG: type II secretion system protein GspF [Alphaproteobacteria bacterium RIFCSPHIGHO2_12_FULL_63_12]|nr:MAG: type II secretion system protein GspF [Alphaproteobacteria bacterium RIFCSPHIGHO2_12_FULL_63_12]